MSVNIPGLIGVIIFYIIILVTGIIAARKTAKTNSSDEVFLANRNLGTVLSFFTLTASMVGGAFINGTAEMMAFHGLFWVQAPFGYCLAMLLAGIFFAPKMRRGGYVTMFDPFQVKYGKRMGGLLFFPQVMGDLFWSAAILSALGSTVSTILSIDTTLSIVVSACVTVFYTFLGGLYSVAYTDVIQFFCIVLGLVLAFPFALVNPSVNLNTIENQWLGEIEPRHIGHYIDTALLLIFGGIPWQTYYQRALACKTPEIARKSTIMASLFCILMAVPPMVMGVAGAATDWNTTTYLGELPIPKEQQSLILPLVLQHLCPPVVSIIGTGALAAAVMSSADSCVLSTGTVFAKNIYKDVFRAKATEREMIWVLRASILAVGAAATVTAIQVPSVYGLFTLCSDLIYVILFPQLTCVLWVGITNTYGSMTGYIVALILRIGGGDTLISLPPLIKYPFYDEKLGQLFPFRTLAMLTSFATIVGVSYFVDLVFRNGWIPLKYDVFQAINKGSSRRQSIRTPLSVPLHMLHAKVNQEDGGSWAEAFPQTEKNDDHLTH